MLHNDLLSKGNLCLFWRVCRERSHIFSDVFQVDLDPSNEDILQQDLEEWDSFNHLRLVAELEDVFQITLSDEEIPELISLQQVKALLGQRGITRAFETGS